MMMTLNRGEGGQNIMSNDFDDALGLVRTEELLAADATKRRTVLVQRGGFRLLEDPRRNLYAVGHDRRPADAVRVVRLTRPLVITSVFVGGPATGHGHHGPAGEMARSLQRRRRSQHVSRADRRRPQAWSPLKMYARVPTFAVSQGLNQSNPATTQKGMLDSGHRQYVPVRFHNFISGNGSKACPRPTSRFPRAITIRFSAPPTCNRARGWSFQKSQNGGAVFPYASPGCRPTIASARASPPSPAEQSFFDGVDVSLAGIADLASGQPNAFLKEVSPGSMPLSTRPQRDFSAVPSGENRPGARRSLKETNALVAQSLPQPHAPSRFRRLARAALKQREFQQALFLALE